MQCDICKEDFLGDGAVKTYGRHRMCIECLRKQTPCRVCWKKRAGKNIVGVCQDCNVEVTPQTLETPPPRAFRWATDFASVAVEPTVNEGVEEKGICPSCKTKRYLYKALGETALKVCSSCRNHSGKCVGCGKDTFRLHGSYEKMYCPSCQKENLQGKEYRWSYVPPKFFRYGGGDFMLGAENEVQLDALTKAMYLDQIARGFARTEAYTMYDGTINYGTEVVFHPRTLKSYQKLNYEGMLGGIKPHEQTGMHVHIERTAFLNKMHLYKFIRFIVRNREFISLVAERGADTTLNKSWKFTKDVDTISKVKGYDVDPDKYMDVNMLHRETVELRIFKGATTAVQFLKNLEFSHALALFSKVTHPRYMTAYRFKLWLNVNSCNYPNLLSFLAKEGK